MRLETRLVSFMLISLMVTGLSGFTAYAAASPEPTPASNLMNTLGTYQSGQNGQIITDQEGMSYVTYNSLHGDHQIRQSITNPSTGGVTTHSFGDPFTFSNLIEPSSSEASIWTDKEDYAPDEIVIISGTGFNPLATIEITVERPSGRVDTDYTTSDDLGDFVFNYNLNGTLGTFYVSATDGEHIAYTSFTDSTIDFKQFANDDQVWIGSALGPQNSLYYEGMAVPQRLIITNIESTVDNLHTLTFSAQATKGGVHAFDWLTGWDQTFIPDDEFNTCGPAFTHTTAEVCNQLYSQSGSNEVFIDVPDDSFMSKDGSTQARIDAYEAIFGNRQIRITAADSIVANDFTLSHTVANFSDTGDSYIDYTIQWTSASSMVMIEMAGHLSVSGPTANPLAWGEEVGASFISGGPYHFKLGQLDGQSTGSQDNQIKAGAILPADADLKVEKSGPATAEVGETITYSFNVSNAGPAVAFNVMLNDTILGDIPIPGLADLDGDGMFDDLGVNSFVIVNVDYTVPEVDQIINTAMVNSTSVDNNLANNQDTHTVDVLRTNVDVTKTGPLEAERGDIIQYLISITNTGEVNLSILSITDSLIGDITSFIPTGDDGDGIFKPGETWVYTVNYQIQVNDPDPLLNEVTVNAVNLYNADPTSASDSWSVDILDPEILLTKIATDGLGNEITEVYVGETVTYEFYIENTGDADLFSITLLDLTGILDSGLTRGADIIGNNDDVLNPGEIWFFTGTHLITLDDADPLDNVARAEGTTSLGTTVFSEDDATVDILHQAGTLTVVKTGPDFAYHGDMVTYTIAVTYSSPDGSPATNIAVIDDVYGVAIYISGDTDMDGHLDVTETWIFEVSGIIWPHTDGEIDPIINTATATGEDLDGDPVTPGSDSHETDILHREGVLTIVKSGPDFAYHGDMVTYTFEVSYSSEDNSPATNIVVFDDTYGFAAYVSGDTDLDGLLDVTETWIFDVSGVIQPHVDGEVDPIINTVTVTGEDLDGDAVTPGSDSHETDILHREGVLSIVKSGPGFAYHEDIVVYTFEVTYSSPDNSPATNIVVFDDTYGLALYISGDTDMDGLLDVSETWMFEVSGVIQPHVDGEIDPIVNTATVTGEDLDGDPVTPDSDSHITDILHREGVLTVVKSGPLTAYHGDVVVYTFEVTYSSPDNSPATNIVVFDDTYGLALYISGDTDMDGLLDVSETWMFEVSGLIGPHVDGEDDPIVNTVTATGEDLDGDPVTPGSDSHETDILHREGVLSIVKSGPDTAYHGDLVTYSFAVTYSSDDNSPATNIVVFDDTYGFAAYVSGDTDMDGLLDTTETWIFEVSGVIGPHADDEVDPIINTVTVTGEDLDGDEVTPGSDSHETDILHREGVLSIVKSGPLTAYHDDMVTYTFEVTYSSEDNSPATNIVVLDDTYGLAMYVSGDTDMDGLLDVTETWIFEVSGVIGPHTDGEDDPIVNTVTVTGEDLDGDEVTPGSDSHETDILHREGVLTIVKTGPDFAFHGDLVTYTFAVSYSSDDNSPATNVVVFDDTYGFAAYVSGDVDMDGLLDVTETWIFEVSGVIGPHADDEVDPIINTVTVTGEDLDGDPVTPGSDSHETDLVHQGGALNIIKSGPSTAYHGDMVTYTFEVTYSSPDNSPAMNLVVFDDTYGFATYVSGDLDMDNMLDVTETWIFQVSGVIPPHVDGEDDPIINIVTVTGEDGDGDPVTPGSDSHETDILHREGVLSIEKSGPTSAYHGDAVTYTLEVSYSSADNSPATNLVVFDDIYGMATYISGDTDMDGLLDVTETWIFEVSGVIQPHADDEIDPIINTVTVTGEDLDGDAVTPGSDSHETDILHREGVLSVVKDGPGFAYHGDMVTYSFAVTYSSPDNSPATNIVVLDDTYGLAMYVSGDTDMDGLLDVTETWIFQVSGVIGPHVDGEVDPIINTVIVTGEDLDGDPVTPGSDSHETDILHREGILSVEKTGPNTAYHGDMVTYTIEVSYSSPDNSPATNIVVFDDIYGLATYISGDADMDGLLDTSETWIFEVSGVIGIHVDSEIDPIVNTATATGEDLDGDPVTPGEDDHITDILHREGVLSVVKSGPDTAYHGDMVTYTFEVTYSSPDNSPALSVVVTDDVYGLAVYVIGDADMDGMLDVTETWIFEVSGVIQPHADDEIDPIINNVLVTGEDLDGDPVTPGSDSHETDILHREGVLSVVKDGPLTVYHGDTVTYTFAVTYSSPDNSPASNIVVLDDTYGFATYVSGDVDMDGLLDVTETWMYEITVTFEAHDDAEIDPVTNIVTVTGEDPDGDDTTPGEDDHTTDILHREGVLSVVKSGPATAYHGDLVTYSFAVTYSSDDNSPATNIVVLDDTYGLAIYISGDTDLDGLLDVDETWIFEVSGTIQPHVDGEVDPIINTVTVTGEDLDGDAVTPGSDSHETDILHREGILSVVKDGPLTVYHGDTVTYTFAVTYSSPDNSPASNIVVFDDTYGFASYVSGDTDMDGLLDVTETWMYEITVTFEAHDDAEIDPVTNTVTVTGEDPDGDDTTPGEDDHTTDILHREGVLSVVKDGPGFAYHGDMVTYTFAVTYSSDDNSPATNVVVFDDTYGFAAYVSGDADLDGLLDVDETWIFQVSGVIGPHSDDEVDPIINTVTVTGEDLDGDEVTPGSDSHETDILHREGVLTIVKSGPDFAYHSDMVTYTFAVTYSSDDNSPATNIFVIDDTYGVAIYVSGDLDADGLLDVTETWMFEVSGVIPPHVDLEDDPIVNTVYVTGEDLDGDPVTPGEDDHSTDILHREGVLSIVKSGPIYVHHGDMVTYTFEVTYSSPDNSPATNVEVLDDIFGLAFYVSGDTDMDGLLDVEETWMFEVFGVIPAHVDGEIDPIVNTVTVTGKDLDGDDVTPGSDSHETDILHPAIEIDKQAKSQAVVGETVVYTFVVTNTGDTILYDVELIDDTFGIISLVGLLDLDGDGFNDDMLPGGVATGEYLYTVVDPTDPNFVDPLINTADVRGVDILNGLVQNSDTHTLDIFHADIAVCKVIDSDGLVSTTDDQFAYAAGWTMYLYKDGVLIDTQVTNPDGCYTWRNLGPGDYAVEEALVEGWTNLNGPFIYLGQIADGSETTATFANFQWFIVSGYKWHDLNGNSNWDVDEPALEGWNIGLYDHEAGMLLDSVLTDANGYYQFLVTNGGLYSINETLLASWRMTYPHDIVISGGNAVVDGYTFTATSGGNIAGFDFGNLLVVFEGARSPGYWKTHTEIWFNVWQPDPSSIFYGVSYEDLANYFPGMDENGEAEKMNLLEMLRAQLLAAELNIFFFDDILHYDVWVDDIYALIDEAEAYLANIYSLMDPGMDLDSYWDSLSQPEQVQIRQDISSLKDKLDAFNNQGDEIFETDFDADGLVSQFEFLHTTYFLNPDTDSDGLKDGVEVNETGTDPNRADTDGDGLPDGAEINAHGTDPFVTDTDGDGLLDGAEVKDYGTDPNNPDTDGDGITDGDEVANGTDPLVSNLQTPSDPEADTGSNPEADQAPETRDKNSSSSDDTSDPKSDDKQPEEVPADPQGSPPVEEAPGMTLLIAIISMFALAGVINRRRFH